MFEHSGRTKSSRITMIWMARDSDADGSGPKILEDYNDADGSRRKFLKDFSAFGTPRGGADVADCTRFSQ